MIVECASPIFVGPHSPATRRGVHPGVVLLPVRSAVLPAIYYYHSAGRKNNHIRADAVL